MLGLIVWVIILFYIVISIFPEMIYLLLFGAPVAFLLADTETLSACIKKFFKKNLRKIKKS